MFMMTKIFYLLTSSPIQPLAHSWSVKDRPDLPTYRLATRGLTTCFSQDAPIFKDKLNHHIVTKCSST